MIDFKKIFNLNKKNKTQTKNIFVKNGYAAGTEQPYIISWTRYKESSDEIIDRYYQKLVARSCEQCQNNPYAVKYLELLNSNVIGPMGMKLQAKARDTNGQLDIQANEALESAWEHWQLSTDCDVTGRLNFPQMQRLILQTVAREGNIFIKIVSTPQKFYLQLIDPRRLDFTNNKKLPNGNFIRFGIEFNKYGKVIAYHIKNADDTALDMSTKTERIPASEIIHPYRMLYVGQKLGLPWFSSVLEKMYMLSGYEEAAVANARAGACQMGFLRNTDPDVDTESDKDDIHIDAQPAAFTELPPGYVVDKFDPNYPSNEFDPFVKANLRSVSAGLNVGYNTLGNDLTSVNYSSLRQGALDERDSWTCLQEWFKTEVMYPVYFSWLKHSLLAGKIQVGRGVLPAEKLEKYKNVSFRARRWAWVDPVKDVSSATASVSNGFRSRSDVIREQGRDPEEVWTEIAKENEFLIKNGLAVELMNIKDKKDEE